MYILSIQKLPNHPEILVLLQLLGAAETLNTKRDMQPERKQIQSLSSRPMTQSECFILVSSVGHRIWVIHFELPSLIVVLGSTKFG